jgi:TetR/AcrR family transcriptional regulator, cholesterol catabolism regulator
MTNIFSDMQIKNETLLEDCMPLPARSKRRVHSKSIERRQRILDAAARALAVHGYSEAKLSDIAQEAGTHAGSLYYYFSSREDLVKEVLVTSLDRISSFSDSLDTAQFSPLERVLAFMRLLVEQTLAPDDHYFRAYLRNGNQVPEAIHSVLQARRHQMRHTLAGLIEKAQEVGQISKRADATIAAQFLIGATNWVNIWYEPAGPHSIDKIVVDFVALALNGLRGDLPLPITAPVLAEPMPPPRKRRAMKQS